MSDEHLEDADEPMSLRAKIVAGAVVLVALGGALFGLMRMGSPAIVTSQTAPAGHYPLPCEVCHVISVQPPTIGTP